MKDSHSKKLYLVIFIAISLMASFFFLPLVIANGLIVNQTETAITKIYTNDQTFSFTIRNSDSFVFYNISVEPNNLVSFPVINQLVPGQIANVTGLILSNESFALTFFKVQGYYNATTGVSNTTHNVTIDYYNGILPKCDFSIIKGDKINFINLVPDEIDIKNAVTGNIVKNIKQNESFVSNFDNPEIFKYVVLRRGFIFTPVCTITVLSDIGLINNPELDGRLNLSLNVVYNPTTINYTLLEHNYTLNVFQSQDGVMTITNTGNQTARNVTISGDWFSFNSNNFNLDPGQTKGVVYTIRPVLSKTEDTNKSWTKQLSISGNFVTLNDSFNIFVNYAILNDSNLSSNYQSLLAIIQQFCKDHPNEVFCKDKPQVVYVGNGSENLFNVTYSQEQVKKIYDFIFSSTDDQKVVNNYLKENVLNMSNSVLEIKAITINNSERLSLLETERQKSTGNITMVIVIFLMLGILAVIVIMILVIRRYKVQQKLTKW